MALDDFDWSSIIDSGIPEAAGNGAADFNPLSGLDLFNGDTGAAFANFTPEQTQSLLTALSSMDKTTLAGLLGASGPLAGLLGQLASGGQGPTQRGSTSNSISSTTASNSLTNQSGTNTQNSQDTRTGFTDSRTGQTLDPAAQAAMDRLNAQLGRNDAGAQGAYNSGLSMLEQLAQGQMGKMTNGSGASSLESPSTTPTPSATGNFPGGPPTDYNAGIGNLIKQAFGSFTGDLASNAITSARNRGFAGGADLLGTAAAPMMGQTLAQVPAMEAKAYLDHVLQAYDLESQNAGRVSSANAQALNAGTNALQPGIAKYGQDIQKYGIDRQADNQQIGQITSLLQALMGPQRDLMTGNTNLLNAAPRGSTSNSLTGSQNNQSLSGATTSQTAQSGNTQSNSLSQSNTSGTTTTPTGTLLGQGLQNVAQGAATGVATQDARDQQAAFQKSIMDLLARRG